MNYIDRHIKTPLQDKAIDIIICKHNNKYIIRYSSDTRILARKYELI